MVNIAGLLFKIKVNNDKSQLVTIPKMLKELVPADQLKAMSENEWKKVWGAFFSSISSQESYLLYSLKDKAGVALYLVLDFLILSVTLSSDPIHSSQRSKSLRDQYGHASSSVRLYVGSTNFERNANVNKVHRLSILLLNKVQLMQMVSSADIWL